jgi:UDP-N-acetylglucosamine 2-epimerase
LDESQLAWVIMFCVSQPSVAVVFGTRPEAIKMAPVVFALREEKIPTRIIVSAQHREMLDQVLDLFGIEPDLDLDVMVPDQSLGLLTSNLISKLDFAMGKLKPSMVLVHGDTTTTFCASLAAFYHQVPVGHVEAGLRTRNIYSPWPEEINRQLTGRIATWNYAPTGKARQNLLDESVREESIVVTGNTVIDALLHISTRLDTESELQKTALNRLKKILPSPALNANTLILVTGHRRENFGPGFERFCEALKNVALRDPTRSVIYPVHLNPNVQSVVRSRLCEVPNIFLCEPLQYLEFIYLMKKARLIITDSGGIQEEAPALGIPVLVSRDTTERPEAIEAGTALLVGTDDQRIVQEANRLLESEDEWQGMAKAVNPFGDGRAAQRIVSHLKEVLS